MFLRVTVYMADTILPRAFSFHFYRIESLGIVTFLGLFNVQSETLDTYLSVEDVEKLHKEERDKLWVSILTGCWICIILIGDDDDIDWTAKFRSRNLSLYRQGAISSHHL